MTEKSLERKLKTEVEKLGGLCLKCATPGFTGMPDRKCLFSPGRMYYVEMKKPKTGILSERQRYVHKQLRGLGFYVVVIWSESALNIFLSSIKRSLQDDL